MLKRLRASKWLRAAALLVFLGFCAYGLVLAWPQVHPALARLRWYAIAGSLIAAMASAGCMMLGWRRLLSDLGSQLPVPVAARVTFVAQLGKYAPGAIWSFAAHVELGHDYDVPRRRGAASVIVALAVAVATGIVIAAATLPLASPAVARRYLLFLAIVPVIAACLAPKILLRLLNLALKIIRQEPLERPVTWRGLGVAIGWTLAGWLLMGLQVWFLLAGVAKTGVPLALISVGSIALASSLALLLVVFPNGIGAREVILVAALAPILAPGPALAVALTARAVTTVSDLTWGGIGLALTRRERSAGAVASRHVGRHRRERSPRFGSKPRARVEVDPAALATVAGRPAGTAPSSRSAGTARSTAA